jgi:hypothetical protein
MRAWVMVAVAAAGLLVSGPVLAAPVSESSAGTAAMAQADPPRRAPPRIIVMPRRSYAVPDRGNSIAYPGRGYVRSCTAWLEPDARPSGTVIVPRQHCGWVRGQS